MNCSANRLDNTTFRRTDLDCVEECFQKLRNHILGLQKCIDVKDQQLEQLQERCEKLSNVVNLQQRQLWDMQTAKSAGHEPKLREKRRRCSEENHSSSDETGSASKLNMALNSEELLNTIVLSPNANDLIAETENVRSPRIFSATSVRGLGHDMQHGLQEHNTNKLVNRCLNTVGALKKQSSSWLSKELPKQGDTWGVQFLRSKAEQKKLSSLSLNKKYGKEKLKQTRLQLVVLPPNPGKQENPLKQCNSGNHGTTKHNPKLQSLKKSMNETEDAIIFFSPPSSSNKNADTIEIHNLENIKRNLFLSSQENGQKDDDGSESVVEVPAGTQEVVILDDTTDDNNTNSESESNVDNDNRLVGIKQEKITQSELNVDTDVTDNEFTEEFDVRPIVLKAEPKSAEITPHKRRTVARFETNCADCKMYLRLYVGKKSDQEIEAHLSNCLHSLLPLTPEGFWNPLLESFPAGDPRNETLIDTRFAGKNRFAK